MSSAANIVIHQSQFPEKVRRDLLESLRSRRVNHKFHYDSVKQTHKWLALHEAHSPARYDLDCLATYRRAFKAAIKRINDDKVYLIGLGCGGGQKDVQLLKLLSKAGKTVSYTPCDVGGAMTLVARKAALAVVSEESCIPVVCDLATADDLPDLLITRHPSLITFFGMIPNFEPQIILPKLAALVRKKDWLLFSANLAPGPDYSAGMGKILPQYDNALTRDWLMTFLLDLGIKSGDGSLRFSIENGGFGLKRVVARFHFARSRGIQIGSKVFEYRRGESVRLFFSYRYTPERVQGLLGRHGISVLDQWTTKSGEEGVFLCRVGK